MKARKKTTYKAFDPAEYLDNDAVIAEYLSAVAEDPNPDVFVAALGDVAKARGMAQIAKDAGLGRESLYNTLERRRTPSLRNHQFCPARSRCEVHCRGRTRELDRSAQRKSQAVGGCGIPPFKNRRVGQPARLGALGKNP